MMKPIACYFVLQQSFDEFQFANSCPDEGVIFVLAD
jgi:hypothetical protein